MKIQLGDGNTAVCFEGQRLTQAKTIAARHGRKGGRPRLAADTAGSGSPAASKTGFTEPAQAAGDSESELAREAIDDHLARRSPNPPSATSPTGNGPLCKGAC